jgi:DNA-binding NtrC family response regulator
LLRVLESGEFYRVGSVEPRRVDVTILAATNRDLEADVRAGRFREDLYYRLNVVEIRVPPLRERRDDIMLLTARFLADCRERMVKAVMGLAPAAERLLMLAPWPGNVRELRNVVERAVMMADGALLDEHDVRLALGKSAGDAATLASDADLSGDGPITREQLEQALAQSGGNRLEAARALGVSRRTFYRVLHRLNIILPPK